MCKYNYVAIYFTILIIYVEICVCIKNILKVYYELLISLCVISVHVFVRTIEYDCINQVGVEPVPAGPHNSIHFYYFIILFTFNGCLHYWSPWWTSLGMRLDALFF